MKAAVLFLLALVLGTLVFQLNARGRDRVIGCRLQAIVLPRFPGGDGEWRRFLERNTRFDSIDCVPNGTVRVVFDFHVDTTGAISDIKMTTNDCPSYGRMLLGALRRGPHWIPAMKSGRKIPYRHSVLVSTCLLPSEE